ncbi:hypothetical protein E4U21_001952 [Claviceps maximensis]|nr:hypothetical protein E4U21_001952 [Claviceps maximensis]
MLFQTIASLAVLATAANAASTGPQAKPYRLAVMALPGQSLMRRDTSGYKPDQKHCKAGNTCAEACGATYAQCPGGLPDVAHCFNPAIGQSCCTDNSGNSCDAGFYCTHDDKKQTWCCPNGMDLNACAAAFSVAGLVPATAQPAPSTSSTSTSTTSTSTRISTTSTTSTSTTSSTTSHTPTPTTTSAPLTTAAHSTTTAQNTTTAKHTTICSASLGNSTAWAGSNSTIVSLVPTQPSNPGATTPPDTVPPVVTSTNAAAASGVSALLLVAAAFIVLL